MGLYSIVTRASGTVLTGFGSTSNIFNVDHLNHVTHTEPESINSAEADLTAMQTTVDPFVGGAVNLPASLTDEVERLRFTLAQVKQRLIAATTPPQWYEPIAGTSPGVFLPPTAVRRELNQQTAIPSGADALCPFNVSIYNYGISASASGIIIPVTGNYLVGASVGLGDGAGSTPSGVFRVMLTRDPAGAGARRTFAARTINTGADAVDRVCVVETVARLNLNDTFNVFVFQTTGSSRLLTVNATVRPAVWLALIGR